MRALIRQFGRWRLLAMVLTALPLLVLPTVGMVWLWQSGFMRYWLAAFVVGSGAGYLLHRLLLQRERRTSLAPGTQPDPHWPDTAGACWTRIEQLAAASTPSAWPLEDSQRLALLGRNVLEMVARHYHPHKAQPLLELTVPHTLLIIERAARELRRDITDNIPFSHKLTLGDLALVNRWRAMLAPWGPWWRLLRAVATPQTAVFSEIRRALSNQIVDFGLEKVKTWLLQEYVRKVGYHAIALYSGQVVLSTGNPADVITATSQQDRKQAEAADAPAEPLRIVVLGRTNAGKSSLINALFGKHIAPADILPDTTTGIQPYHLQQDGRMEALILDTPGYDAGLLKEKHFKQAVLQADLILWVTAANRADRQDERQRLDAVRAWLYAQPARRPAPLITVISHIDLLRPAGEWQPPYDLSNPESIKAASIASAVRIIAGDLHTPLDQTIPVCLVAGWLYNVHDTLWAAILERQDEAERARFLRCLEEHRRSESRQLSLRQLASSGRLLFELPGRLKL